MHIGLYFGSFNPIHTGHLIVANHIVENTEIDKIWFIVSPHNPLKEEHSLLNEYDRLHLVELAIGDNPRFRASNVEFRMPKPSYTIDTLTYLAEKFPLEKFSVIAGSDSFQNIHRWKNYQQLVANYSFIIYKRPGFEIKEKHGADLTFMEAPLLEISSTYIRKQIKEQKSVRYLLPEPVHQYITDNRYYL
ncbi:MAG: nicotinate-nucleotide adenylyltransferase [Sphingobacteriales bacterium]|nr:MAG: nicotinate-nucleotide adenylyltransferase [Sphingobacteriales bacterium]